MTRRRKRNVPPFKGGTRQHLMRKAFGVNAAQQGFLANVQTVGLRSSGKNRCNA
jgi:hypothetical protein